MTTGDDGSFQLFLVELISWYEFYNGRMIRDDLGGR